MEWDCQSLFSHVFVVLVWSFHPVSIITLLSAFVDLFILKFHVPSFPRIYPLALLNEGGWRSISIVDTPAMKVWVSYASHWGAPIPHLSPHALRLDAMHVIHTPTCMLLVALELVCEHGIVFGAVVRMLNVSAPYWVLASAVKRASVSSGNVVTWNTQTLWPSLGVMVVPCSTFWTGVCPHFCPTCSAIFLTSPSFNLPETFLLTHLPWNFGFLWWNVNEETSKFQFGAVCVKFHCGLHKGDMKGPLLCHRV